MHVEERITMRIIRTAWFVFLVAMLVSCSRGAPATPAQPAGETAAPTTGMAPTSDKFPTPEVHADLPPTAPPLVRPTATGRAPAQPQVPTEPIPGMELESIPEKRLTLAVDAGAYWIRRNAILWSDVERTEGKLNWSVALGLEKEMALTTSKGAEMVMIVRSTPAWAQKIPGYFCGPILPEKLPAFANFLYEAVRRYSVPPYNVLYWELGNEPDIDPALTAKDSPFGCWGDASDPYYGGGQYAEMLKVVYPRIKEANPDAQVLVGGLLLDCDPINPPEGKNCAPARYLEGILKGGGGPFFDGVSYHAYDYYTGFQTYTNPNWHSSHLTYGPVLIPKGRYLRSVLNANGAPGKFLINTESGLVCGRDGTEPDCQSPEFEQTKASYVALANVSALAESLRGNLWYSLTGWRGTALVDKNLQPLPAYDAYKTSAEQILKARFIRELTDFPGLRGYELEREGQRLWFLVSSDGLAHTITLPNQPVSILDVFGAPLPVAVELTVDASPVYILFEP
jgi:hypothetical protein